MKNRPSISILYGHVLLNYIDFVIRCCYFFYSSFTLHRNFSNAIKNSIYHTRALIDCWPSWGHVDHPTEMEHSTTAVCHRSIYSLNCLRKGPLQWYHLDVMATHGNSIICPTACWGWHQRKKSDLHTTITLWGSPPVTVGFPSQRARNEPSVPRHHDFGIWNALSPTPPIADLLLIRCNCSALNSKHSYWDFFYGRHGVNSTR